MTTLAAIDCGTHSIRLLIARAQRGENGEVTLTDLVRRMEVVGLGQGVDRTRRLAPEALERTLAMVDEYAGQLREFDVESLRFVATSASRDAENSADFVAGVRERLGVEPEVISGQEEASLSFRGATFAHHEAADPVLVVDIGGGSTEFAFGRRGDGGRLELTESISTDMGCTRVTERFLKPSWDAERRASGEAVAAAREFVRGKLDQAGQVIDFASVRTLIGVAGTVTTLTAICLGLDKYDPARIDGAAIDLAQFRAAADTLVQSSEAERRAYGPMHPGRVDVIAGGAVVWSEILAHLDSQAGLREASVSEHDILDGIALSQLP